MRLFVGLDVPDVVRPCIAEVQRRLRKVNAKIAWVAPQNLHLTLKFLGETEESQAQSIREALNRVASEMVPVTCELRGVGQFPRVIWAGLEGEIDRLGILARKIDDALAPLGFPREEREFRPHLTIGRIKFLADRESLTRALAFHTNESFGAVRVESVHLFQSTLTPQGPIYTKLFTAQLKGNRDGHQT